MTDFLTRLEHELVDAAERRARPAWRRWTGIGGARFSPDLEPRSRRGPLAIAVAAVVLVLAPLGLMGGSLLGDGGTTDAPNDGTHGGGGGSGSVVAPGEPVPSGSGTTIASGRTDRGEWRLAAHQCATGGVALTLDGREVADCQDPSKPITIQSSYEEQLDETFVYGIVGRQIAKVRVEVGGRREEVRARTAAAPLPDDTRFYVARVPGRRDPVTASGLSQRGDEVACVPASRCVDRDEGGSANDRGGSRRGSSSGGKTPGRSGGSGGNDAAPPQPREKEPERVRVEPVGPAAVIATFPSDRSKLELKAYACGDNAVHHVMMSFWVGGQRQDGPSCRWQVRGATPPPLTAASVYSPVAKRTFIYGVVVDPIDDLVVTHDDQRTAVAVQRLDTSKDPLLAALPDRMRFFVFEVPGRQGVQDVDAAGDPGAITCKRGEPRLLYRTLTCRSRGS